MPLDKDFRPSANRVVTGDLAAAQQPLVAKPPNYVREIQPVVFRKNDLADFRPQPVGADEPDPKDYPAVESAGFSLPPEDYWMETEMQSGQPAPEAPADADKDKPASKESVPSTLPSSPKTSPGNVEQPAVVKTPVSSSPNEVK